jgi:hypothetical protein
VAPSTILKRTLQNRRVTSTQLTKPKRILNLPQLVGVGMLFPPVGGKEGLGVALKRLVPEEI